jgi:hypothetical protein
MPREARNWPISSTNSLSPGVMGPTVCRSEVSVNTERSEP